MISEVPSPTSESALEKFVKLVLDNNSIEIQENMQCAICKEHFANGETILITTCKHAFHDVCIEPWLKMSNKCPNCRALFE